MQSEAPQKEETPGYYMTIAAFCALSGAARSTIRTDRANGLAWLLVAVMSCIIALALAAVRITVTSNRIVIFCLGVPRVFPTMLIDRRRFNDFADQCMFQLSLRNGHFVMLPRSAFADATPFAAIEAASAIAAASNLDTNKSKQS